MLETIDYRARLKEVLIQIEVFFEVAEIRGSDVASFIFAEKGNRAIELYQSDTAVIVEFWKNDEQQTEKKVVDYDKAKELVIDWIKTDYEN